MMERIKSILETEGIQYEDKVLAEIIQKYFPDFRRILNELQRYSVGGKIDVGILSQIGELNVKELMKHMKNKDFSGVRKWVVKNLDNDQTQIFRKIYDGLYDNLDSQSIPLVILILGEYQYKAAFVADAEINMVACLVQIMMEANFK
jgi:DNA polymerase III delta prime subunit